MKLKYERRKHDFKSNRADKKSSSEQLIRSRLRWGWRWAVCSYLQKYLCKSHIPPVQPETGTTLVLKEQHWEQRERQRPKTLREEAGTCLQVLTTSCRAAAWRALEVREADHVALHCCQPVLPKSPVTLTFEACGCLLASGSVLWGYRGMSGLHIGTGLLGEVNNLHAWTCLRDHGGGWPMLEQGHTRGTVAMVGTR